MVQTENKRQQKQHECQETVKSVS